MRGYPDIRVRGDNPSTILSLPDVTTPSTMPSLTLLLCCHYPRYYDVTTPSTMTSLPPLLWRHYPLYYDVTTPSTMTALPPLLWRHYPLYYDVINSPTMMSLPPLLWRHYLLYYDVITPSTTPSLSPPPPPIPHPSRIRTCGHANDEPPCYFRRPPPATPVTLNQNGTWSLITLQESFPLCELCKWCRGMRGGSLELL